MTQNIIVLTYEIPDNKITTNTIYNNTVYEYSNTCQQLIESTQNLNFSSGFVGLGPKIAPVINIGGNPNSQTTIHSIGTYQSEIRASNFIKITPNAKTLLNPLNTTTGKIRMHIAPGNGCVNGGDALQIDHYFGDCNPDPLARLIGNSTGVNQRKMQQYADDSKSFDNVAYLYPNPNDGNFVLFFKNEIETGKIQVVNNIGLIMYETTIENTAKFEINNLDFKPGVYFVNLLLNNKSIKPIKFIVYE